MRIARRATKGPSENGPWSRISKIEASRPTDDSSRSPDNTNQPEKVSCFSRNGNVMARALPKPVGGAECFFGYQAMTHESASIPLVVVRFRAFTRFAWHHASSEPIKGVKVHARDSHGPDKAINAMVIMPYGVYLICAFSTLHPLGKPRVVPCW